MLAVADAGQGNASQVADARPGNASPGGCDRMMRGGRGDNHAVWVQSSGVKRNIRENGLLTDEIQGKGWNNAPKAAWTKNEKALQTALPVPPHAA